MSFLFWKKNKLPEFEVNSALKWKNTKRLNDIKMSLNFIKNLYDEYYIQDLSKEIYNKIKTLELIYDSLSKYYIMDDQKTYNELLKKFPNLSTEKINELRKELLLLIKDLPKKYDKQTDLISYLNKKYEKEFINALRLYENNKEIILIKIKLYNKFIEDKAVLDVQDKILIKKLYRFIQKEEMPLLDKIFSIKNFLDGINQEKFNDEVKSKIYNLKIISNHLEQSNFKEIIKKQYLSLKKYDLKNFIHYFDEEIKSDLVLSNNYSILKKSNSFKRTNKNILIPNYTLPSLSKIAASFLILISTVGGSYAQNFLNNNQITQQQVLDNLNKDGLNDNINNKSNNKDLDIDAMIEKYSITFKKDTINYNSLNKKTIHFIIENQHLRPYILANFVIANKLNYPVALEGELSTDKPLIINNYNKEDVINKINEMSFSHEDIKYAFDINNINVYGTQRFNDSIKDVTVSIAKCQGSYDIANEASRLLRNFDGYFKDNEIKIINDIIEKNRQIILSNMNLFIEQDQQSDIKKILLNFNEISPFLEYYNKYVLEKRDLDLEKSLLNIPENNFTLIYGAGHKEAIIKLAKNNNINLIIYDISHNIPSSIFPEDNSKDAIGTYMGEFYNDRIMDKKFLNMFKRFAVQRHNDPNFQNEIQMQRDSENNNDSQINNDNKNGSHLDNFNKKDIDFIIPSNINDGIKDFSLRQINMMQRVSKKRNFDKLLEKRNYSLNDFNHDLDLLKNFYDDPMIRIDELKELCLKEFDFLFSHFSSQDFFNKAKENMNEDEAIKYQQKLIENLNSVKIEFNTLKNIKTEMSSNNVVAFYDPTPHKIIIPVENLNYISHPQIIMHELLHAVYMDQFGLTPYERDLLYDSFRFNIRDDFKNSFSKNFFNFISKIKDPLKDDYSYIGERIVGKKVLDFELIKKSIKKYNEPFTEKHYVESLKLANEDKLPIDAKMFILTTKKEDLIKIMNEIAYHDNNQTNNLV